MHVSIDQKFAKIVFGNEILNSLQSLGKSYNTMYHGSKSELTKRFSKYSIYEIPKNAEKSAIIIEMFPLICAKNSQKVRMTCVSGLSIILYYEIMRLGFDYNRIAIIFDCYFDDNLKEGARKSRGTGTIFMFDDDTVIPQYIIDNFLRSSHHKKNLNGLLSKK